MEIENQIRHQTMGLPLTAIEGGKAADTDEVDDATGAAAAE
jgi:hypothetical protein